MLAMIAVLAALGDESPSFTALGSAPEGGRFFRRGDVDFWASRTRVETPAPPELWPDSTAPAPVRRLLESPSKENARAYLAWQKERMERLRGAMAALEEAKREEAPPPPPILYFSRPGCAWCAMQEKELQGLPVARVPEGSPLWEEHAVRVTPTLVVNGKVLRGLATREAILKELSHD